MTGEFVAFVRDLGWLAYPVCLLVMTVAAIVPIPAEFPAMLNGAVLGLVGGSVVTWLGAMLGAAASFEGATWFRRRTGERVFSPKARAKIEALGARTSAVELLLLRLTPVVAFHLINYAAGVAQVPRRRFYLTTALGIAPGSFAFTAAGMAVVHWFEAPWLRWGAVVLLVSVGAWRVWRARVTAPSNRKAGGDPLG